MILHNIIKTLLHTEESSFTAERINAAAAWALGKDRIDTATLQMSFLQPIAETLNKGKAPAKHYFTPQPLTLGTDKADKTVFFPKAEPPSGTQLSDYIKDLDNKINSWAALEYYGASIACATNFSDVSVFDFVKTTVALTDILGKDSSLVILNGNVSGIQTYIYDIISKSAAKNMKGRSFYIQLLTETVLQLTLDKLGLKSFHVLYASGGGFYILAPTNQVLTAQIGDNATVWVENETFTALRQDINTVLLKKHGLGLSFDVLCSAPIKPEDKDFKDKWSALFSQGSKAKMRRHAASLNAATFNDFFMPHEVGGMQERDTITNEELNPEELNTYFVNEKDKTLPIRKITRQQIDLGKILKDANYWTITRAPLQKGKNEFQLYDWDIYHNFSDAPLSVPNAAAQLIGTRQFNTPSVKTDFTYYGGNDVPRYDKNVVDKETGKTIAWKDDPKFFEDLAQGNDFDRLGILRMDVDNLGTMIKEGIQAPCFARLSTLSRSLDYFFKGFLNTLWEKDENRKAYSFILYSGGDDLFIIGRWDVILSFAMDIQQHFRKWVCGNPQLTISGGVVLVPAKFPIVQAAALAKTAEGKAKKYERPLTTGQKKNAFCFLNTPLDWDFDMPLVLDLKNQLLALLKDKHITKSLLDKINAYASTRKVQKEQKTSERWKWVMAYDLTRYTQTLKNDDAKAFVQKLYTAAYANTDLTSTGKIKSEYAFIELLQIAARWAEFDYRTDK